MANNTFTGATDNNWGTGTNWSLGAVPTAADGNIAVFDGASPNCTVNASNRVCNNIDLSAYTNTITMSFNITVSGNVTLGASMGVAGSGSLVVNSTGTLSSNGKRWPNPMTFTSGFTYTLGGGYDWAVDGLTSMGLTNSAITINKTTAEKLLLGGGMTQGHGNGALGGSAEIVFDGSGTITWTGIGAGGTGVCNSNVTVNMSGGSLTIAAATIYWGTGTLLYTAGTVSVNSSSTLDLRGVSCTLTTDPIQWAKITSANYSAGTQTNTLASHLTATGLVTLGNSTRNHIFTGAFNFNMAAGLTVSLTSGFISGSTTFVLNGTGTLAGSGITTGRLDNTLVLNNGAATFTFDATLMPYMNFANVTLTAFAAIVIDGVTLTTGGGRPFGGSCF